RTEAWSDGRSRKHDISTHGENPGRGRSRRAKPARIEEDRPGGDPMPAKQTITSIKALRGKEIAKGVTIKPLAGDHVMLNYVEFVPHGEVPLHSHHHEQLGLIIEGELEMEIGGEQRTLRPGDTYLIP